MAAVDLTDSTLTVLKDLDTAQNRANVVLDKWLKERESILFDIDELCLELDKHSKRCKIAKLSGNVASTLGSVMTGAGLALSFVTLGVSNILTISGVAIGLTGVGTAVGSDITEFAINKTKAKEVHEKLKEHEKTTQELCETVETVKQQLSRSYKVLQDSTLLQALQSGKKIAGLSDRVISLIARLTANSTLVADSAGAVSFVYGDIPLVAAITSVLSVAMTAAALLNAVGLLINATLLTTSAMDVHKGKGSDLAEQLRAKRHTMQLEKDVVKKDLVALLT